MKIISELNSNNKNLSLALGFFDGVHIAHAKLISKTIEVAKANGLKSAVITFTEAPAVYFGAKPCYITTNKKKAEIIEKLGVDYLYTVDFSEYKDISAKNYIESILIKNISPKFVITGYNHRFGHNKEGDYKLLESYNNSFQYIKLDEIKIGSITVSSSNIKQFIQAGDFKKANEMLGRNFSISGNVVQGNQIARQLGYKTANIIWAENIVKPRYGVYFGFVNCKSQRYRAIINFGIRPSVDKALKETLEAHILDFDKDIYGENIDVEFSYKIRDEIKFASYEELKNQIKKDVSSIA